MAFRRCLLPIIAGVPVTGAGALLLLRQPQDTVLLLVAVFLILVGLVLIGGGLFANLSDKHKPLR